MSSFIPAMRGALLYLSRQRNLRQWLETSPDARRLTSRFIAGLTLDDAARVAEALRGQGLLSSLDHLGENVSTEADARTARDAYLAALQRIAALKLPSTISMKVTSLGLDISPSLCEENTDALVRAARQTGSTVEFDMEDSSYTDRNLALVYRMHERYGGHVRAVIQSYLYRSEADVDELCRRGIPVRLCKGAYQEPASVAWPDKRDVDASYVRLMKTLLDRGTYPAIGTHDEAITGQAIAYIRQRGIAPDRFEFQMLYGVRRKLQSQILARNFRLRLYVPYGAAWYPYFMRRLAERPANVLFVARSLAQD
ncbi:MAG TPA: proline dehydrogenase family protein [Bryobacteraceae bacterium]|nr:proline dehydrogenase family protein [Bryobacteraceae bacterium]